jgi:single-strand DNA-binding protein
MVSFNKVFLMGNLTRDPQVKNLPSQMVVAEFGLAINRKFKTAGGEDREEVAFIDCVAFGRQAETISQYCTKGKPIFVEGRLKYDQWDDKAGNGKRSKLTVTVENFQFLPGAGTGADGFRPAGERTVGAIAGGEQGKMFGGEERKPWRGRGKQQGEGSRGQTRDREPVPAAAPLDGEKQFDEADIPF